MKQLTVAFTSSIPNREYPIFIGEHLIEQVTTLIDLSKYSKLFIITDKTVEGLFLETLQKELPEKAPFIALPSGEQAKDVTHLANIWKAMINAQLDRKSLVINLGGGVIGDIGGFAASTYMRGIDFINIPTTLLSQVDESVGGKTMIDFAGIKNIVGTFYQPTAVIIDVDTLQKLPERQLRNGFAEIIKHGLIKDKNYFDKVTSKKPTDFSQTELIDIIEKSNEIKREIVQSDENENGPRKIINFGHTIGHAIEALSFETDTPLLHGEAISIGMKIESELSYRIGLLAHGDMKKVEETLIKAGLPTDLPNFPIDTIIEKMKSDKKNQNGNINFTLLKKIGKGEINQIVEEEIIKEILTQA